MKRYIDKARHRLYDYWTRMMHSTRVHMPRGAQYISRMIGWARGEGWRRNHGHREDKK
jgi:hypothetical protein